MERKSELYLGSWRSSSKLCRSVKYLVLVRFQYHCWGCLEMKCILQNRMIMGAWKSMSTLFIVYTFQVCCKHMLAWWIAGPGLAHRRLHAQRNHQDDLPCPTLSRPLQQEGLHRLLEDLEHMCRCTTSGYKIVVHLHMPQCILRPTSMDLFGCSLLVCSALVYCNETSLCFDYNW